MKIKWYGRACMVLESNEGIKVICDPYDKSVGYIQPKEHADIVTVSHEHHDHNAVDVVGGWPAVIRDAGEYEYKGIMIKGIHAWHDREGGSRRGGNIIFKICMDNVSFVHMGDIGHVLTDRQIGDLLPCDIVAVPVGGVYTVDAKDALKITAQLNPKIVIPMHYHTPSDKVALDTAEEFLKSFLEVRMEKIWSGTRADIPREIVAWALFAHGEKV